MINKKKVDSAMDEIAELKELFEKIKTDTEKFFKRSKALSESGVHEAQELIDAVKDNWEAVTKSFGGGAGVMKMLSGAFSSSSPKTVKSWSGKKARRRPPKKALRNSVQISLAPRTQSKIRQAGRRLLDKFRWVPQCLEIAVKICAICNLLPKYRQLSRFCSSVLANKPMTVSVMQMFAMDFEQTTLPIGMLTFNLSVSAPSRLFEGG